MSIEMCILASGSGGNCTVVRTPKGIVLIDAGIGPRTASRRLDGTGLSIRDVCAVCLTHLDSDHFSMRWAGVIREAGIRVFCHESRRHELARWSDGKLDGLIQAFDGHFEPLDGLVVRSIRTAHDSFGSHAFLLEGFGCRVGYATDLGCVPPELLEAFLALDVLALESNYDPTMQLDSPRPAFLKHRIMGGRGHLSNEQALDAIRRILDRHESAGVPLPAHIVLLHRSRLCNCPRLVRHLFSRDRRIARRLTLAEQFHRSDWLRVRPSRPLVGEQLMLAW